MQEMIESAFYDEVALDAERARIQNMEWLEGIPRAYFIKRYNKIKIGDGKKRCLHSQLQQGQLGPVESGKGHLGEARQVPQQRHRPPEGWPDRVTPLPQPIVHESGASRGGEGARSWPSRSVPLEGTATTRSGRQNFGSEERAL
ncbi:hypothetical protein CBS101457_003708 [Exobasidium rhododendri]|nr:hypothetical protein CBS101457_003708 [Exobasidium rhododendri]